MFGGLIAHLGRVVAREDDPRGGARLRIVAPQAIAEGVARGDSVAIDGVCLTVVAYDAESLTFDVVPETLERSALGELAAGAPVNVELSLRLGDRLGGHLVYGHVDAASRIVSKEPEGQGHRLILETPEALNVFIVDKGYIALSGVSLTVAKALEDRFEIALIPETSIRTSLGFKGAGDRVNLEIDPVARYALAAADRYTRGARPSNDELAWAYEI